LNVAYAIVLGQSEVESQMPKLRDMKTGEEKAMSVEEIIELLKKEA
ncbi:MAG: His/Gly/Thr/Pro-type tRNA ligase C-terminal domain-containing protein, partial [Aedoeadaptatus pacaensis]